MISNDKCRCKQANLNTFDLKLTSPLCMSSKSFKATEKNTSEVRKKRVLV